MSTWIDYVIGEPLYDFHQDGMAVEVETAEFLYGLVRLLKPEIVLESGTGKGVSAYAIGHALRANGFGRLVTYEPSRKYEEKAREVLQGLPVEVRSGSTLDWQDGVVDIVFLDSHADFRQNEIRHWLGYPVFLIVHDAQREYGLRGGIHFDTPRGLWMKDSR